MAASVFSSTDVSAPILNGAVGSIVALLDACLVNGYGTKSGAGWSKVYTGTNKAAYKTGRNAWSTCLYVDNSTTLLARVTGYATMSNLGVGTFPFPYGPVAVSGNIPQCIPSGNDTISASPWTLIADNLTFYLFVSWGFATSGALAAPVAFGFGEYYSYTQNNTNNFFISGPAVTSISTPKSPLACINGLGGGSPVDVVALDWISQPYSKQGQPTPFTKSVSNLLSGNVSQSNTVMGLPGIGSIKQPNLIDGSLFLSPVYIGECDQGNVSKRVVRGTLRGLYAPGMLLQDKLTIQGSGVLSGSIFLSIATCAGATTGAGTATMASVCFETSKAWDTN